LYRGYKLHELWDMTIIELKETLEPILEKEKEVYQQQAVFIYNLAELTGLAVNEPKKYPKELYKIFPNLFDEPKTIEMPDWLKEKYAKRGGQ